jgi:hypothetical protein
VKTVVDLRNLHAQNGDGAGLATVILHGTGGIVGALMMILEWRHIIKAVNDICTQKASRSVAMAVAGSIKMAFLAFKPDKVDRMTSEAKGADIGEHLDHLVFFYSLWG